MLLAVEFGVLEQLSKLKELHGTYLLPSLVSIEAVTPALCSRSKSCAYSLKYSRNHCILHAVENNRSLFYAGFASFGLDIIC